METDNILDVLLSLQNPAIYAIVFTAVVIILAILIKKEYINPLTSRKKKLELENIKLNALYSEADPDPILRVNNDWNVIGMNNSANEIFGGRNAVNANIKDLIPDVDLNLINSDSAFEFRISNHYFSITVKEIEDLGFKQIYLHDITKRVEFEHQIKDYQKNLKELHAKINSVNEEEKQRIGKELHDSVGHSLSLLKLEMQNFFNDHNIIITENSADKMLTSVDKLSEEIRELSHQLKPRILTEFGLGPALRSLVDRINSRGTMRGYVNQLSENSIRDITLEQNIYRICQEALNNIIKHSECDEFSIEIMNDVNKVKLVISDDGMGFDVEEQMMNGKASLGLLNMKERAESMGASLNIDSIKNMGTSIYLSLPLNGKNHD